MGLPALAVACLSSTFSPSLPEIKLLSIQASLVTNYTTYVPEAFRFVQPSVYVENAQFCNVTITYSHAKYDDKLIVEAWLPIDNWNERLLAVGGGGNDAGRIALSYANMAGAISEGYATITTDAGAQGGITNKVLDAPGVINWNNLRNFGYIALGEQAVIAKSLIQSFYGQPPRFSYWNGCSQGGRQGLALAQNYPDAYDGISAAAPGLYAPKLAPAMYWPQQYMNNINTYPRGCELDELTLAAIEYCDDKDGTEDGLIDPYSCNFDPSSMVGKKVYCNETASEIIISAGAAAVIRATWDGITAVSSGEQLWHGLAPGADVTGNIYPLYSIGGVASTNCTGGTCQGLPSALGTDWITLYLAKNDSFDTSTMTDVQFQSLYTQGIGEFSSLLDTATTDLSAFQNAGGKMVTFHGMGDAAIPEQGTREYYTQVMNINPDFESFYRYFPIPGLGHCMGGQGGQPNTLFERLRAWVENGTAPELLTVTFPGSNGTGFNRVICPYPRKATYRVSCGSSENATCWACVP